MSRAARCVVWSQTSDPRFPYAASPSGEAWLLRINEFPEEPSLYSLFINGEWAEDFIEWPRAWERPDHDQHEAAEYARELEHAEHTRSIRPSKLVK